MKIVVDAFGGDNAPHEIVKGCVDAVNSDAEISIVLTGREEEIARELAKYKFNTAQIEIVNATEVITNEDVPTTAIKTKKDSSMVRAMELTKTSGDIVGMISAGSTGAILAGGIFKVGRIKGIQRPALAPILPTVNKKEVCLLDCGANVDCRAEFLTQFALMGSSYMSSVFGIEKPRVALLSNGTEDKKGNALTLEAFELLKNAPINFVGNMEARDALSGEYDVIVCDGFVGNVFLKAVEGTASMILKSLKSSIMSSFKSKIGAVLMKKSFRQLKNEIDYNSRGGAPLLGLEKIVLKSHGSSNAQTIKACIFQVKRMANGKLVDNIKTGLSEILGESESGQSAE